MKMVSADNVPSALHALVERASQLLVIITPYFEPWTHLSAALHQKLERKIQMLILLRGGEDRPKRESAVFPFRQLGAQVQFLDRLHAKIYLSEHEALLTSMNLIGASRDSWEVGTIFDSAEDTASYKQIVSMATMLFQTASRTPVPERSVPLAKRTVTSNRTVRAHCIRCSTTINTDPDKPFCRDYYTSWKEWENIDYQEKYCHICGRKWSSSMAKPLCRACWEQNAA